MAEPGRIVGDKDEVVGPVSATEEHRNATARTIWASIRTVDSGGNPTCVGASSGAGQHRRVDRRDRAAGRHAQRPRSGQAAHAAMNHFLTAAMDNAVQRPSLERLPGNCGVGIPGLRTARSPGAYETHLRDGLVVFCDGAMESDARLVELPGVEGTLAARAVSAGSAGWLLRSGRTGSPLRGSTAFWRQVRRGRPPDRRPRCSGVTPRRRRQAMALPNG